MSLKRAAEKKWTNKKFITTHPSGTLATSLIQVKEIMAKGKDIPLIPANKTMRAAIINTFALILV